MDLDLPGAVVHVAAADGEEVVLGAVEYVGLDLSGTVGPEAVVGEEAEGVHLDRV